MKYYSTNKGKSSTSSTSCFNLGNVYCNPELTKKHYPVLEIKECLETFSL